MKYTEYLNQPGIIDSFNLKYHELKDYFKKRLEKIGFSKEQNDVIAMKLALMDTDYQFSQLFENENKEGKKEPIV